MSEERFIRDERIHQLEHLLREAQRLIRP